MSPSPKVPTSRSLLNSPKWRVARTRPQGVERAAGDQAAQQCPAEGVDVDETVPGAGEVIMLGGVLQGLAHIQLPAQVGDADRRVPGRAAGGGDQARVADQVAARLD